MAISVCVVGASGLVGRELVSQLLNDASVAAVHAIVRRSLNDSGSSPKFIEHITDFDNIAVADWPACDVLCCCLGTTIKVAGSQEAFRRVDFDYVVEAGKRARQAGAKRLLAVSAMGADRRSMVFYNRVKGEMEAAIVSLGYDSVTIFRPSLLTGERIGASKRRGEHLAVTLFKFGNLLLPKKYQSISGYAVARSMLLSLEKTSRGVQIVESGEMQKNK